MDAILGCEMEETLTCDECPDEPPIVKTDAARKLVCNIQSANTGANNIDHLMDGVKLGLKGSIEKHSAILGRDALWTRTQRIKRLPRYLCVQFMRFYVKEAQVSQSVRRSVGRSVFLLLFHSFALFFFIIFVVVIVVFVVACELW